MRVQNLFKVWIDDAEGCVASFRGLAHRWLEWLRRCSIARRGKIAGLSFDAMFL